MIEYPAHDPLYCYIAGPLHTSGRANHNVRDALAKAKALFERSERRVVPFVPHLHYFWDIVEPAGDEFWLELDFQHLKRCHALWRLPGESKGGDMEVALAEKLGIPVFRDLSLLLMWAESQP